jgi:hypothetical protein
MKVRVPFLVPLCSSRILPAADKIGLNLSAKACFNPTAAPEYVYSFMFSFDMLKLYVFLQDV